MSDPNSATLWCKSVVEQAVQPTSFSQPQTNSNQIDAYGGVLSYQTLGTAPVTLTAAESHQRQQWADYFYLTQQQIPPSPNQMTQNYPMPMNSYG